MCKAFSFIATRKKVYWKLGLDGHEEIKEYFKLKDAEKDGLVPCEIVPEDYLNMEKPNPESKKWDFKFDEKCPDWWKQSHETMSWNACLEWYNKIIKLVNWEEARKPIHPFELKEVKKVTIKQKVLLKRWDSVRGSVWDSVWDSVRGSVWDSVRGSVRGSVRDSVWGYTGSLFYLKRTQWKYTENVKTKGYPFQPVVDLWKQGLVPSFDGKYWRLHTGRKAKIVFKISKTELMKIKNK